MFNLQEYLEQRIEICAKEVAHWHERLAFHKANKSAYTEINTSTDNIIRWLGSKEEAERILAHIVKIQTPE